MKQSQRFFRRCMAIGSGLAALAASPMLVWAQQTGRAIGQQTLGRPYWHVFAAYAIAWVLVFGWAVSIARRLRRVEERLGE
jgi:CcmD family protein